MSVIDDYLKKVPPDKRKALQRIRAIGREAVPDAGEVISYGMPALTYRGQPFLGFDVRAKHIGIYPFSGSVLRALKNDLGDYRSTPGALQVPFNRPITKSLLRRIVTVRLKAIRDASASTSERKRAHRSSSRGRPTR